MLRLKKSRQDANREGVNKVGAERRKKQLGIYPEQTKNTSSEGVRLITPIKAAMKQTSPYAAYLRGVYRRRR